MPDILEVLVTNGREVYRRDAPTTYKVLRACCTHSRDALPRWTMAFHCMLEYIRRLFDIIEPMFAHNSTSTSDTLVCIFQCMSNELHTAYGSVSTQLDMFSPMWELVMDHQGLLWKYLNLPPNKFRQAWKVREKAANLLKDMAGWFANEEIEQKLVEHHRRAEIVLVGCPISRWEAVEHYRALCRIGILSFHTIQCDAALLSGDCFWLCNPPPFYPRGSRDYTLFFPEHQGRLFRFPDTRTGSDASRQGPLQGQEVQSRLGSAYYLGGNR